ncbi:MAG TPA: hypothetical protein VLG28_12510 [Acidimicrobiia bacterium]|nr:hypothetical protein [Acidimicrobiia bacterium]
MGSHPAHAQWSPRLTRIAQVVPNLPTFAVDDGFSYRVPDALGEVTVGSLVRVPLGGRRLRGVVTHVRTGDDRGNLKDIAAIVGDFSVLTPRLLETLRWASIHYVAPLSVMLSKTGPPNVARRRKLTPTEPKRLPSPLPKVSAAAAAGTRTRATYLVGGGPWGETVAGLTAEVLAAGRNAAVIAPTVREASSVAASVAAALGVPTPVVTSSAAAAEVTATWVVSQQSGGNLLIGTRELAFWPMGDLALVVVIEEGRAAMKAPQTPTTSVRDVVRRRASAERFGLVFLGPVPTVEAMAAGVELPEPSTRVWPLVEIADRTEEPPGGAVVMQATVQAIRGVRRRGGQVLVFVPRHGDAAAFRCVSCGELRRCPSCAASVTRGDVCQRCETRLGACAACGGSRFQALGAGVGRVISELRRSIGDDVGRVGEQKGVQVGTARDLPEVHDMALSVVIDADALVLAPHYRAEEDALRTLARVALTVERGRGRRCLIQTGQPGHRVFDALRHGRPADLLNALLAERVEAAFPPVTQLLAVEVTDPPDDADVQLRQAGLDADVRGPAVSGDGVRWLVSAPDLRATKLRLRSLVQSWRDGGAKVRIDADPVRL